ncbi:hypothetical protein ABBQ38_006278 [Trebouxia sp. C0009 RCD-2024]
MPIQQCVCVITEDGQLHPVQLHGGRLDVSALKEHLANEGLELTMLNGAIPTFDSHGMSRTKFFGDIKAQTQVKKDEGMAKWTRKGQVWTGILAAGVAAITIIMAVIWPYRQ